MGRHYFENINIYENSLFRTFLFSLFIHLILILPNFSIDTKQVSSDRSKVEEIKVLLMVDNKKELTKKKMQVVETEITKNNLSLKNTRFLGKTDQAFKRQTVAKSIGSFKKSGRGVKSESLIKKINKERFKTSFKDKSLYVEKEKIALKDLSLIDKKIVKVNKKEILQEVKGVKDGLLGKIGFAQSNDYVEDVPLGDVTNLNTVEYKYFGFYNRIKQKLEQFWGSTLREKADAIVRSGKRMPASSERITSLIVVLDKDGNIIDVSISSTSGVKELDDAAIESFNKAGPFPNPPKGMLKNGVARIEWGFVVKS